MIREFIKLKLETSSLLHIGDEENGILIDKRSSLPFLSGTSLAGSFRNYISVSGRREEAEMFFGKADKPGMISISDACGSKMVLEERQGIRINPSLGSAEKGALYKTIAVAEGCIFDVLLSVKAENEKDRENAENIIKELLRALNNGSIRIGAGKTKGFGKITVNNAESAVINMDDKNQFWDYLEDNTDKYYKVLNFKEKNKPDNNILFKLSAKIKTPVLIAGKATKNHFEADGSPLRNEKGEAVISGSSLKGVMRKQVSKIAQFKKCPELVEEMFGNEHNNSSSRKAGKILFEETEIKNEKNYYSQNIKIDKFTSGTVTGSLNDKEGVLGDIEIKASYNKRGSNSDSALNDKITALMCFALRDAAMGEVSFGSNSASGWGIIEGEKLEVLIDGRKSVIDFKDSSKSENIEVLNKMAEKL